jgi:hypothetical protein
MKLGDSMADETGIDNLVLVLERISLEHSAMKALLHDGNPHSWRRDVLSLRPAAYQEKEIRARFDALHAVLLSNTVDTIPVETLIAALEHANLDDDPRWIAPEAGLTL